MIQALCHIIMTRIEDEAVHLNIDLESDKGSYEGCLLPRMHSNYDIPHVFRLSDGRFIAWKDDMNCECCEPEDEDRCIEYWGVSEREYHKYVNELRRLAINTT